MPRLAPYLLLAALAAALLAPASAQGGVVGVWLSPDWFFPGSRTYTPQEVRTVAAEVLGELSRSGTNTVFLETWLRGYSIAPAVRIEGHRAEALPFEPGVSGLPLYRHLDWHPYGPSFAGVEDPLQIFIEEGARVGIEVHAWVHCFYWNMDNTEVMLPWHSGPSLWNDLLASYLREEADRLEGSPAAAPDTLALMREAAALYDRTNEDRELEQVLDRHRVRHDRHPLGALLRQAMRAGAAPPEFLLIHSVEDPFPAPRSKELRPIFLNPACPEVTDRLADAFEALVKGHPGLAGLHLDHIRYPVDGQGLPEALGIESGSYNYYSPQHRAQMEKYERCHEILREREEVLRAFVAEVRRRVGPRAKLSAAVLPLYYRERDNGRFRLSGYDFACQDWYRWDLDFVVPMLYEFHPYLIREMLKGFAADLEKLHGRAKIAIYPGVSRWQMARSGALDQDSWVFFDLTLARDVKLEREPTEDLDFGPD